MRALAALTLPAFDADVLAAAPPALVRLTLLADTLPYAFFDRFLPTRPHITHLALPHFVGVPPGAGEVPPAAVPALTALDTSPGLAAALAPGRPLQRVTLRVASTLYDGLRPAALFGALGGQLKELVLVLAPDVDARTRGRLLGALAKTGGGLETLELRLEGKSDEVRARLLSRPRPALFFFICVCLARQLIFLIVCTCPCALALFRSPCTSCTSRSVRCYLTYGRSALFVYGRCGPARLSKWTTRRGWRCGRDRHRDRRCVVSSSPRVLIGNSSAGSGCASTSRYSETGRPFSSSSVRRDFSGFSHRCNLSRQKAIFPLITVFAKDKKREQVFTAKAPFGGR
jgi:hypothetical protein